MNYNNSIVNTGTSEVADHTNHATDALRDTLEHLISTAPFTQVMATLARVCHSKAQHISTSVDEHLAQAWDYNATQCKRAAAAALPTEPTIQLRSIKLGIEPGELQRRIHNLPEPLRVIAMDYFHGALPPAGRSNAMRGILRDIKDRIKGGEDDIEARRRAA
jgi:hypothetical protein